MKLLLLITSQEHTLKLTYLFQGRSKGSVNGNMIHSGPPTLKNKMGPKNKLVGLYENNAGLDDKTTDSYVLPADLDDKIRCLDVHTASLDDQIVGIYEQIIGLHD